MTLDTAVYLESGGKRVFAVAVDWPGWARSGRDEAAALAALDAYRRRYATVVPAVAATGPFRVVERIAGGPMTDFGALAALPAADRMAQPAGGRQRWAAVLRASWAALDAAAAGAPAELRKGPRGGGRDAAAILEHVLEADRLHAAGMGGPFKKDGRDAEVRAAILEGVLAAEGPFEPVRRYGFDWTPLFAARRCAWHALDHAWEIEDRS